MKLKLRGMDVIFIPILYACFFLLFSLPKLILHSFHFDVAKKELFQDTQEDAVFNHTATARVCADSGRALTFIACGEQVSNYSLCIHL